MDKTKDWGIINAYDYVMSFLVTFVDIFSLRSYLDRHHTMRDAYKSS